MRPRQPLIECVRDRECAGDVLDLAGALDVSQGRARDPDRAGELVDAAVGLDPVDEVHHLSLQVGEAASRPARGHTAGSVQGRIALEQPDSKLAALLPQLFDERREDRDEGVGTFGRKDMHKCVVSSS